MCDAAGPADQQDTGQQRVDVVVGDGPSDLVVATSDHRERRQPPPPWCIECREHLLAE